jgi:hypothetical protein
MHLAKAIFSGFKDRNSSIKGVAVINKEVQAATWRGYNAWGGAAKMVTHVVWAIILADCVIKQQNVWMDRAEKLLADGEPTRADLMELVRAIFDYLASVRKLKETSPTPTGIHCDILKVIETSSYQLKEYIEGMSLERSTGRLLGDTDIDALNSIVLKTIEDLGLILSDSSEIDVAAQARAWDADSTATSVQESTETLSLEQASIVSHLTGACDSQGDWSSRDNATSIAASLLKHLATVQETPSVSGKVPDSGHSHSPSAPSRFEGFVPDVEVLKAQLRGSIISAIFSEMPQGQYRLLI